MRTIFPAPRKWSSRKNSDEGKLDDLKIKKRSDKVVIFGGKNDDQKSLNTNLIKLI